MPPKQAKKLPTKAKKPPKKLLAKQREEEERRLREEEEARLQTEKDEQERLERERKEEELEKLELKDRGRREDELKELSHLLEENHAAVTQWKTDTVEKAKWDKYMCCDGSPDPTVQQEINTYISLWRDDQQADIKPVLHKCNDTLKLMEELDARLRDVTDPQDRRKYQENLISLQEVIHSKHQITTEEILKRASADIDTETGNMQTVIRDDNITLCLWANLKKNPRFKGLNFQEAGLGFELPKQLAVSNIAVRILHTHYDHLTSQARMAHLRVHTASHRSLAGEEELCADVDVPEQEETKEREEVTEEVEVEDQEVQSTQGLEERKSAASFQSRRDSVRSAGSVSQIQTQMEAVCAERDPAFPPVKNGDHVVDLRQYTPLGGVFYYDVFHLPPQAHQMNGWDIREVLDKGLQVFPYPGQSSSSGENGALTCPPIGVTVTLPETVIFLETPQVACWDAAEKQWRMDGVTDVSYEEAEFKMSFKMDSFKAFVLMQETYANFPFQRWELRPLDQNSALFTVSGALTDVSIMIKGNQCILQAEQERGLSHLREKWMSGPALQRAMFNAGINIFVDEYTNKYVSTTAKDPLMEQAVYEQMALFASACAFSWSKWNAKCGAEHLVMQVCEHRGPGPVPRDSWSLYLLGAQRSQRLEITESSEAFSPDHYPGSEFHSTFIHMLQDSMSADGITKTRESDKLFVDTVQSLLCATRPLMHA